jgi:hypothetical protein
MIWLKPNERSQASLMTRSHKRLFKASTKTVCSLVWVLTSGPNANITLPEYRANLNHPHVIVVEHGKAVEPARTRAGQTSPQGGSRATALRGPKKPRPVCNAPDMPTSVWSEMAREHVEPHMNRRKQMTTDSRRLMHPGVDAPRSTTSAAAGPYCQAARGSDSGSLRQEAAL